MNLTPSEKLLLLRRRQGLTQAQMARKYRQKTSAYTAEERGAFKNDINLAQPPTVGERSLIRRRRARMTQSRVARSMGVSRVWLLLMEHDRVPNEALEKFWTRQ